MIGFFCGILPGIGATLAAFMGYNEAVRWSKTPEEFGKGKLEGVISSETANNAATGAAMIPLLALGLPGGASDRDDGRRVSDARHGTWAAGVHQQCGPGLGGIRGDVFCQCFDFIYRLP